MPPKPCLEQIIAQYYGKFGRWSVLAYAGRARRSKALAWCICDCGTVRKIRWDGLLSGYNKSCGCYRKTRLITHGHWRYGKPTKEYKTWESMMGRSGIKYKSSKDDKNYRSRGIVVCERWESFENFFADMGVKPEGMSLDRIDNNGPYSPENCRWATPKEQLRNTRVNRNITFDGKTYCLTEWAEILGIHPDTLSCRIVRYGWTLERAFSTPTNRKKGNRYAKAAASAI